ncbi:MAG: leucine-rich repeat protein [Clostridia bacterium]|nr:leucine-rich repeat protein [Clostridia bacterium]
MLEIAAHAFANCGKLDGVVLPDALVTLGDAVFENCLSLTAIDVLAGGSVGNVAFRGCAALTRAYPPGAAEIGESALGA